MEYIVREKQQGNWNRRIKQRGGREGLGTVEIQKGTANTLSYLRGYTETFYNRSFLQYMHR